MSELVREDRLVTPTVQEGDRALAEARRLFRQTLASWASDLLAMRHGGDTRIAWRSFDGGLERAA